VKAKPSSPMEQKPPKVRPPPKDEAKPPKEASPLKVEVKPPLPKKVEAKPPKVEAKPPKDEAKPPKEASPPKVEVKPPGLIKKPPKHGETIPKVDSPNLQEPLTQEGKKPPKIGRTPVFPASSSSEPIPMPTRQLPSTSLKEKPGKFGVVVEASPKNVHLPLPNRPLPPMQSDSAKPEKIGIKEEENPHRPKMHKDNAKNLLRGPETDGSNLPKPAKFGVGPIRLLAQDIEQHIEEDSNNRELSSDKYDNRQLKDFVQSRYSPKSTSNLALSSKIHLKAKFEFNHYYQNKKMNMEMNKGKERKNFNADYYSSNDKKEKLLRALRSMSLYFKPLSKIFIKIYLNQSKSEQRTGGKSISHAKDSYELVLSAKNTRDEEFIECRLRIFGKEVYSSNHNDCNVLRSLTIKNQLPRYILSN